MKNLWDTTSQNFTVSLIKNTECMATQNNFVILCHCRQDTDRTTIMIAFHCNRSRLLTRPTLKSERALLPRLLEPFTFRNALRPKRKPTMKTGIHSVYKSCKGFTSIGPFLGIHWYRGTPIGLPVWLIPVPRYPASSSYYDRNRILWLTRDKSQGYNIHWAIRPFLDELAMRPIIWDLI